MLTIAKRHPKYHQDIRSFITEDPLKSLRENLDWARLKLKAKILNTLMVSHNRGGGSERQLRKAAQEAKESGEEVFYLRPVRLRPHLVCIQHDKTKQLFNLPHIELKNTDLLAEKLRSLNIGTIQNHGLVDYEVNAPIYLTRLANSLHAIYKIIIHDYFVICPRINLVNKSGVYCNEPPESECNKCLSNFPIKLNAISIREWRQLNYESLVSASCISVPNEDVDIRLRKQYPDIKFTVEPHEISNYKLPKSLIKNYPDEKLRIVIIGAISLIKGYQALLSCAHFVKKNKVKIQFILMGYSINDKALKKYGVQITGKYIDGESDDLLKSLNPNAIWLPSIWPETYSFTLDIAMRGGHPVFTFDLGAPAYRLQDKSWPGVLMPLEYSQNPSKIIQVFIDYFYPPIKPKLR
jgi:glycosyltransferase involved in cell wall biosynthesis